MQIIANTLWKALSFLIAGMVFLPILLIFLQWGTVGQGEQEIWQHLFDTKLDRLLINTLILILGVGFGVVILGVGLAWLTAMCEFPGRGFFEWTLMLPLAIPGYVMAFVFLGMMNYAGPVQSQLRDWFGADVYFPDEQGAFAVILVLSLVLYPYVYLLARTAFMAQGRNMMDAGRVLGLNHWQAFFRVAVPIARPAIVAGVALALMETLADFGAVSVFNYDTFTTAIYGAWYGLFNITVAAQLASLLLLFVSLAIFMEKYGRKKARYVQDQRRKNNSPYRLKGWYACGATLFCSLVLGAAFVVPLGRLVFWCLEVIDTELNSRYFSFLGHTLGLGAVAALITASIALFMAFASRLPGSLRVKRWQALSVRVATLGYALPGSVLAVGIILCFTWFDQTIGAWFQGLLGLPARGLLVGSLFALILAYSCRFLAVAFAPIESGLERISPSIVEAAKSLGASPGRILRQITIPMLKPGLLTALIIVFVDVMKEMPATLIMRPFGWDTLAVRIYEMTAEGQWASAALPAVTLILIGLIPVALLIRNSRVINS